MFMGFLRWQDFTRIQYTNKNKIVKDDFLCFLPLSLLNIRPKTAERSIVSFARYAVLVRHHTTSLLASDVIKSLQT